MSSSDPAAARERAYTAVLRGLCARLAAGQSGDGDAGEIDGEALTKLLGAALGLFASRVEAGEPVSPFDHETQLSATDVLMVVSALLDAVNLETFELALWQSFAAPRTGSP